jgi:L-amino acid N-acyltransferase YncA
MTRLQDAAQVAALDAPCRVRDATEDDVDSIQRIYSDRVLNGLASFEENPPARDEMRRRRRDILDCGLPDLVAEHDQGIVGYSYAGPYRTRSAYRYSIEDSVYVAEGFGGRGVGRALLAALIARCELGPWRQMVAVIGDSGNAASIALHRRLGFRFVGTLAAVGFKHGRWVDSVFMQRPLGPGDLSPPG